ncbi:MAG: hypothetical protein RLO17_18015 [Cyclobacteriaceae bacterium]
MNKLLLLVSISILFSCGTQEVTEYWNNGELKLIGKQKDGKQIGKWIQFDAKGDTTQIQYYENGEMIMMDQYGRTNENLPMTLLIRSKYRNSKLHGEDLMFYPNGQIYRKGQFEKGVRIDTFFYYNPNGSVEQFSVFDNDRITVQHQYWPNGNIMLKINNYLTGKHYLYDSLGLTEYVVNVDSSEAGISMDTLEINTR